MVIISRFMLCYVLFPIYYLAIITTFFADTKKVIVIDPQDNIYILMD